MDPKLKKSLNVITAALALALVFNFLFFGKLIGISVVIFAGLLLAGVAWLGGKDLPLKKTWWLGAAVLFFTLMAAVRANEFLNFLNICAALGLLVLLALELTGTRIFLLKIWDYITLAILTPLRMLAGAFSALSQIGQIHSSVENRDIWIRVLKGAAVAVPVLILFGILFAQADLAFGKFIDSFIHINISERTMQYLVLLGLSFIAALSFLAFILIPKLKAQALVDQAVPAAQPGKKIEVLVFLSLISALFLIFIVFQVAYLFGGQSNITQAGFTYAEYARRGFWELLFVALISLLLLLASQKYAGEDSQKDKKFLIPALVLVMEVVIVIFSAFKRLSLYIDAYSLTTLRFYVAAFIILLLVLFVLLAVKFIKAKPENFFTFGALLSALGFLAAINLLNPDAFVARANIEQYKKTGKVDFEYVARLSADAQEQKTVLFEKLQGEEKQKMLEYLRTQKDNLEKYANHWQSANFSRARALRLLENME